LSPPTSKRIRKAHRPEGARPKTAESALPSKQELLDYIEKSEGKVGKREIARAFRIKGMARRDLGLLIRELSEEGLIAQGRKRRLRKPGTLPKTTLLDIVEQDPDGELLARPTHWEDEAPPPLIVLAPSDESRGPALGLGERVLARITKLDEPDTRYAYEARVIRRLGQSAHKILGVFERVGPAGRIKPVDRKSRFSLSVAPGDSLGAEPGDLVMAELKGHGGVGLKPARVRERLGSLDDPRTVSLIAVHSHGIPVEFNRKALDEARRAAPVTLGARTDLRKIPLVTIDPPDARDHDDAVFARADESADNAGGFEILVAIADVAHYVTPESALDHEALKRGNSVYFPDRVVPMLPEELSAELCSLKPGEDRACLAVRMVFDARGKKRHHEFVRGLMRSAASLTYDEAEAAAQGRPNDKTGALIEPVIKPLYTAFAALDRARGERFPLELDLPEHRFTLGEDGRVKGISLRERLAALRLIEEFMIQANVAAAETLEKRRTPLIYRVHEPPAREKLVALSEFLETIGIKMARGQGLSTRAFNQILARAAERDLSDMVSEIVLRTQSQAYYGPENRGHFGLNLRSYAHFTSPIRRYSDLIVHRALIRALKLGEDGLTEREAVTLAEIGEEISAAERRAMAAERDSVDRYVAAYMEDHVGAQFSARITGVTRFGLFVRLAETGAQGLVPIGALGNEYFHHDERAHALTGERTGLTFRLGEVVEARLVEAAPITGGLRFELVEGGTIQDARKRPKRGRRVVPREHKPGKKRRR
jgi:ribonuclease R